MLRKDFAERNVEEIYCLTGFDVPIKNEVLHVILGLN